MRATLGYLASFGSPEGVPAVGPGNGLEGSELGPEGTFFAVRDTGETDWTK